VFWRFFLKGSTWKFTWNDLQIPCIGIYSGLMVRCWCRWPTSWEPQEEGMMSTTSSLPSVVKPRFI
jgi:hypothetical protein